MSAPKPNKDLNPPSPVEATSQPSAAAPSEHTIEEGPQPQTAPQVSGHPSPTDAPTSAMLSHKVESNADEPSPMASQTSPVTGSIPLELPDFGPRAPAVRNDAAIDLLNDVDLNVKIELGRANMLIEDVLRLGQGSVVELDKLAGDPVDVLVNDRLVARGEVLVLNDNFCVRISEIIAGVEEEVAEASAT